MASAVRYNPFSSSEATDALAGGALMGFSMRETSGSASAIVRLHDSATNNNPVVEISLSSGQSVREWFGPMGLAFPVGCYTEVVSGAVAGSVWFA